MNDYDEDEDGQEGPKSSFTTYLAEGDALFKQGEYKKALDSYTLALELQPNDKWCLVARSKCYLKLGDPQTALKDAELALEEDKDFNKGLYQKAEALYSMGDFEYALMYYHRGHKLRPELDEFRLGIQKAQEAIDNSIGNVAKVKLENKGDLSFFKKQDDLNKKSKTYSKPTVTTKDKPMLARGKDKRNSGLSKQTAKQLLGELYADKEYLEKLMKDPAFVSHGKNKPIHNLVQDGLNYLETRTEFWRQQKPLYARRRERHKRPAASKINANKRKKQITEKGKDVMATLEKIDNELAAGKPDTSLKLALRTLKTLEGYNDDEIVGKSDLIATCHSAIGNSYLDLNQLNKSIKHHQKDLEISTANSSDDGTSRALDNVGRVYVKMKKFEKAIESWSDKLHLIKSPLESTWLYHEIGRCHMELKNYDDARDYGERSLVAANEAEDEVWQLNASVLMAQCDMKLNDLTQAVESFQSALLIADKIEDKAALSAIRKALDDISRRISVDDDHHSSDDKEDKTSKKGTEKSHSDSDNDSGSNKDTIITRQPSDEEKHSNTPEIVSARVDDDVGSTPLNNNSSNEERDSNHDRESDIVSNSSNRRDNESVTNSNNEKNTTNAERGTISDNNKETVGSDNDNGGIMSSQRKSIQSDNDDGAVQSDEAETYRGGIPSKLDEDSPRPVQRTVLSEDEDGFYS